MKDPTLYYKGEDQEVAVGSYWDRETDTFFSDLEEYFSTEKFILSLIDSGLTKEEYLKTYIK